MKTPPKSPPESLFDAGTMARAAVAWAASRRDVVGLSVNLVAPHGPPAPPELAVVVRFRCVGRDGERVERQFRKYLACERGASATWVKGVLTKGIREVKKG